MNIYVLKLTGGKYYVGKSENVMNRYQQHLNGQGSAWTKKYRPLAIDKIHENASPFDEDKITMEYMSKYGIDKVRGGSYSQIELSEFHKDAINMQIRGATDCCTQCGGKGHFVKDCKHPVQQERVTAKTGNCYRCGRTGHYSPDCYATTHVKGYQMDEEDSEEESDDDSEEDSDEESEEENDDD